MNEQWKQIGPINPDTGEEVIYYVDPALHEYHPEKMGDKDMGYTAEQEATMDQNSEQA